MKLISFVKEGTPGWGALLDGGVVDLSRRLPEYPTLKSAIEAQAMDRIRPIVDGASSDIDMGSFEYAPAIPEPGMIICIGLNYEEHRSETKRERANYPTVFARFARTQIGHEEPMLLPAESTMLDFEGELALVIARDCRRVPADDAMSVIAGYACYNDASIRDYQRHTSQFHPGKNWPSTGAFGPVLVTADEISDPTELGIKTRLNGETVQEGRLDQLIFSIPELIAYCSTWTQLRAGDVIVTGTPGGVGAARTPPLWMKPGDLVEVEIDRVGLLRNPIVAERPGREG